MLGLPNLPLVQAFDPKRNRWHDLAPLPQGTAHIGVATLNGKIFAAGGFKVSADRWRPLPPLTSPRGSASLVALDGMLHVIGGHLDPMTVTGTHEIFNPATGRWTTASPLPTPRSHLGTAVLDGKIHVIGGRTTGAGASAVALHDVYDPATDRWTTAAPLPERRSEGGVVVYRGRILYYGGDCNDPMQPAAFDNLQAYDPRSDRWSPLAAAPIGLHGPGAAAVGNVVYVIGGNRRCLASPSRDIYEFRVR
jgi:N-acetylneuraminic acid mutarotase